MPEVLVDSLQFIAVFVGLQFLALLVCSVFLPVIPATIAVALAGALSRARSRRVSPRAGESVDPGRNACDDDLDMVAVLQSMDHNTGHGNR